MYEPGNKHQHAEMWRQQAGLGENKQLSLQGDTVHFLYQTQLWKMIALNYMAVGMTRTLAASVEPGFINKSIPMK